MEPIRLDSMRVTNFVGTCFRGGSRHYWWLLEEMKEKRVRVEWLAQKLGVQTRAGMSHMLYWTGKRMDRDRVLQKLWKKLL